VGAVVDLTITEFLTARYDEDEAVAQAALYVPGSDEFNWSDVDYNSVVASAHGMRWEPARVLADISAKRRVLLIWTDPTGRWSAEQADAARSIKERALRYLAQPYAEHPDFDPAWRVG
jgi:hypothetical protein